MLNRSAIQDNGMVVLARSSKAKRTLPGWPFGRLKMSRSFHPIRFNLSVRIRSARTSTASWTASP